MREASDPFLIDLANGGVNVEVRGPVGDLVEEIGEHFLRNSSGISPESSSVDLVDL